MKSILSLILAAVLANMLSPLLLTAEPVHPKPHKVTKHRGIKHHRIKTRTAAKPKRTRQQPR